MQFVIKSGSQQFLVSPGQRIRVMRVEQKSGDHVELEQIAAVGESSVTARPTGTIKAKVLRHFLGEKVLIKKHHAKKRYRRTQGHRQEYSELEIMSPESVKA